MNLSEITLPDLSGGLNTREPQDRIEDNQSPDMLNLWFKNRALVKRPGQQIAIANLSGSVHEISEEYNGFRVIHAGSSFLRWDEAGAKNYKGVFDPSGGIYPDNPSEGDYYIASGAGTVNGVSYTAGDRAVYGPAYAQTVTATLAGSVTAAGRAKIIITSEALGGSELEIYVSLALNDTAARAAEKIRAALDESAELAESCEIGGESAKVILQQAVPGTYDETLNICITNDTCGGLNFESSGSSMWHKGADEITPAGGGAVNDEKGVFVLFGEELYHIDGSEVWKIFRDGADFCWKYAAAEPYEPVVMLNCAPDLSESTDNEAYNLLGGGFTVKYNGDAGGNVFYYVAAVPDENTFTVTDILGSTTPMAFTSLGSSGWRIKKQGGDWIAGTPEASYDSGSRIYKITLAGHGLSLEDCVQFEAGTGTLPGGISAFDSDAVKLYKLPQTFLDLTAVKAVVNAVDLTEGTDFTVDRSAEDNAAVTFNTAPLTGTDNVWITAYKTIEGYKERITGCASAATFGGESGGVTGGTRVFTGANPGFPQSYWRSDIGMHVGAGMSYFPDTGEEMLDQTGGGITAMKKMGDELIIFKDSSIFAVKYSYDGKDVYFPVRECNAFTGCDIPDSVQLIDNRLVFANTRSGVCMLISSDNSLENLVKPLSANIDSLLREESGLKEACSCDFERHYMLCAGGRVYLWDYGRTPYYNYSDYGEAQKRLSWYRWDGIDANTFCIGNTLYCGSEKGVVSFTDARDDFGEAYGAYFLSKAFDLGKPDTLKTFMFAYPSFAADGNIKAKVTIGSEDTDEKITREFDIKSFGWKNFSWNDFTWNVIKFTKTYAIRLGISKASYIQVKVSGDEAGRGVGISGLCISYLINGKVREK